MLLYICIYNRSKDKDSVGGKTNTNIKVLWTKVCLLRGNLLIHNILNVSLRQQTELQVPHILSLNSVSYCSDFLFF